MATGGDIIEVNYTHPTLGENTVPAVAGEDNSYFSGGLVTNSEESKVDGAGKPIYTANRKRAFFEFLAVNDQNLGPSIEDMIKLSGDVAEATWTVTIANGTVYKCTGKPVGLDSASINNATFTLRVESGAFNKIV